MVPDDLIKKLSESEKKVLLTLKKLGGKATPENIFKSNDFNQIVEVANASSWLKSKKLVEIENHIKTVYCLGEEGKIFLYKGFPEKRALIQLFEKNGSMIIDELISVLDRKEIPVAVGWLKNNGWASLRKDEGKTIIMITDKGKNSVHLVTKDEEILKLLDRKPYSEIEKSKIENLLSRKNVIKSKDIVTSTVCLTNEGDKIPFDKIVINDEISQMTSSIIKNGEWKSRNIRPYDINAFAPKKFGGKTHPLIALIDNIRQMFLEIGFKEIQGNFVESSFWNMDMLFIPQDHPARDMQDTFYCKKPSVINIQDEDLMNHVAKVHEDGGETSSKGWGYKFSKEECKRALLRTHTTVNTIRYLYDNPKPPCKVFYIGRVFRKENIDSTHLPEFYQIEGIVYEKNTNFRQLIGLLKEFYSRMGFDKIRFRPGYFPYTEPSMEIDVYWNDKWMELGGSGLFRPEVLQPIGINEPVLAWGLGLERLAMLKYELSDMRDLYISDLNWIRTQPLL
jgi:phenylalanyl-tRNA synthetase alpha chain